MIAGLHLRVITGLQAYITLPFVGRSDFFNFNRGGKQGGVETPDEWRILIDYVLEPVVRIWNSNGVGFKLKQNDGEDNFFVKHAVWADSILFGSSYIEVQRMIIDLDRAFDVYRMEDGSRYFQWKPQSLEVIATGLPRDSGPVALYIPHADGHTIPYQSKDHFVILGEYLDQSGSTKSDVGYNCGRAERHYLKYQNLI